MDSDPYGLKILSVYMSGSKNMSYDSASLTTRDIRWLGVRPSVGGAIFLFLPFSAFLSLSSSHSLSRRSLARSFLPLSVSIYTVLYI